MHFPCLVFAAKEIDEPLCEKMPQEAQAISVVTAASVIPLNAVYDGIRFAAQLLAVQHALATESF